MDRRWLGKFYTECGREVSLAYNVLNHSNNWGVTLATAVLAAGLIHSIKFDQDSMKFLYPTIIHWFYIIIAWVIMLRFFVRSALPLINMYRWNKLIVASSKVLSLPESNPALPVYARNCAKKINAYYYNWKSPINKGDIIWQNLKLMYLWFFLIVVTLFLWGVVVLERNYLYWLGIGLFAVPTVLEAIWFMGSSFFKYEKLELEDEPEIAQLWEEGERTIQTEESKVLVFGFCQEGPYKQANSLLNNPEVKWLPWSYHAGRIATPVLKDLSQGRVLKGQRVAFSSWPKNLQGDAFVIRFGRIDYSSFDSGTLRVTVLLDDYDEGCKRSKISVTNPQIFCFYLSH